MSHGASGERVAGVRRICVLRANGVGDLVLALPALGALRAAYPEAEIVLLGRPWHVSFLAGRPGPIDRVEVMPVSRGIRWDPDTRDEDERAEEIDAFVLRMREERFDLAVQLHGGGRYSNPFMLRIEARLTAGLRTPDAAPLDRTVPYLMWQHEVMRYLEVTALVGAPGELAEPRLETTADDRAESLRAVPAQAAPLAVLHPGATDPRRRWPETCFAQVGDALVDAGATVVVTGTGDERRLVDGVIGAMRTDARPAVDAMSLGGLAGLLARAAVVVSNDSGPLHLARAVGTATVGVFWCGIHVHAAPFTRTRHRPLVSWRTRCPECGREGIEQSCGHRTSWVADLPGSDGVAHALDLLAGEATAAHRRSSG